MKRRLTATLVGALLFGGCASDAEPSPGTTTPSSSTQTNQATPGNTVPKPSPPSGISQANAEGAAAMAEYYLALVPYMYSSGDLEGWEKYSHPDCNYCRSIAEDVTAIHAAGGKLTSTGVDIGNVISNESSPGTGVFRVHAVVNEQEWLRYDASGDMTTEPGNRVALELILVHSQSGWIVRGVEVEET